MKTSTGITLKTPAQCEDEARLYAERAGLSSSTCWPFAFGCLSGNYQFALEEIKFLRARLAAIEIESVEATLEGADKIWDEKNS
jgi:hypothetical protein